MQSLIGRNGLLRIEDSTHLRSRRLRLILTIHDTRITMGIAIWDGAVYAPGRIDYINKGNVEIFNISQLFENSDLMVGIWPDSRKGNGLIGVIDGDAEFTGQHLAPEHIDHKEAI